MTEEPTPKPFDVGALVTQLHETMALAADAPLPGMITGRDESNTRTIARLQRQLDQQSEWLGFLIRRVGELEADVYGGPVVSGGDAGSPFDPTERPWEQ